MYTVTPVGSQAIDADQNFEHQYEQYIARHSEGLPRITNVSAFDSYSVKEANKRILENPNQKYDLIQNDKGLTRQRLLNVSGSRIYRILREFPFDEPFLSQCAHWMRAFTGIHLFHDANHRTGMYLLQILLRANELDDSPLPGKEHELKRAVLRSKLIRLLQLDSVRLSDLWRKDEYFTHWHRFFRTQFTDTRSSAHQTCSIAKLQQAVRAAKKTSRI